MIEDVESFQYDLILMVWEKYKYRSMILVGYDYVIRDVDMIVNESVSL